MAEKQRGTDTSGKSISFGRVSEMLRNPKYIGKCSYGGTIYENIVPPIIEKTCFIVCRKDCQKTHSNRGERGQKPRKNLF